jgi:hypothetical protein
MSTVVYDSQCAAKVPVRQVLILGAGMLMSAFAKAPSGPFRILAGVHLLGEDLAGSTPAAALFWASQLCVALYAIGTERPLRRNGALILIVAGGVLNLMG